MLRFELKYCCENSKLRTHSNNVLDTAFPCQVRYSLPPDVRQKAEGRRQKAEGRR